MSDPKRPAIPLPFAGRPLAMSGAGIDQLTAMQDFINANPDEVAAAKRAFADRQASRVTDGWRAMARASRVDAPRPNDPSPATPPASPAERLPMARKSPESSIIERARAVAGDILRAEARARAYDNLPPEAQRLVDEYHAEQAIGPVATEVAASVGLTARQFESAAASQSWRKGTVAEQAAADAAVARKLKIDPQKIREHRAELEAQKSTGVVPSPTTFSPGWHAIPRRGGK